MSIALDPVSILIDSAAHLWQHLEQYATLETRPQRCGFDAWLSGMTSTSTLHVDAAQTQQLQRDYRRLCSLMDQLELVLHDAPHAIQIVRMRLGDHLHAQAK